MQNDSLGNMIAGLPVTPTSDMGTRTDRINSLYIPNLLKGIQDKLAAPAAAPKKQPAKLSAKQVAKNHVQWKKLLKDPRVKLALMQSGINMLAGQSAGQAIGGGFEAIGRERDQRLAEEAKQTALRLRGRRGQSAVAKAQAEALADQKKAQAKTLAEQRKAQGKTLADQKKAQAKTLADQRKALGKEKEAWQQRIDDWQEAEATAAADSVFTSGADATTFTPMTPGARVDMADWMTRAQRTWPQQGAATLWDAYLNDPKEAWSLLGIAETKKADTGASQ